MPFLLFLKKWKNLKLPSAANYRWHFKGNGFCLLLITFAHSLDPQNVGPDLDSNCLTS